MPLTSQQRFTALQSGEVDLLSNNTTITLQRDTALGLDFTAITYYDGQGFMVNKKLGVKSAKELNGATVCVAPGTTTELNLADYFRANKMSFKPVVIEKVDEIRAAFFSGRCDVYTTDVSSLAATRAANVPAGNAEDFIILPEIISKEPLGPMVRHGDNQFTDIVRWAQYAHDRGRGVRHHVKNVDEMLKSETRRSSASLASRRAWARRSGSTRSGSTTSSSRSVTTARASTAMSARTRCSRSTAA